MELEQFTQAVDLASCWPTVWIFRQVKRDRERETIIENTSNNKAFLGGPVKHTLPVLHILVPLCQAKKWAPQPLQQPRVI